jgi:hypothetical protein
MALIAINGTVEEIGPEEAGVEDTMLSYVVIRKEDGRTRKFAPVRAIYEVAGLVEANGAGNFVFLTDDPESRLAFVYRDTGARAADTEALHFYFDALAEKISVDT